MKRIVTLILIVTMALSVVGCTSDIRYESAIKEISTEDAKTELAALLTEVDVNEVSSPTLDIYMDEAGAKLALADIDTFDIKVKGSGSIDIEVAAATELSSDAPDDWINVVAKNFNNERLEVNGKTVSVSVRSITSGEVVTYVSADAYKPNVFIPSNEAWGLMLEASGIGIKKIEDRIAGNTAGILMSNDAYKTFHEKYKDDTVSNVLKAANAGDIIFAYTNPYTSSTGLNMLTAMLKDFDKNDPLSSTASAALMEYQKSSPPVAYTTAVLRNQARKGVIDTMVMEEQAYINTTELRDYKYFPFGIRHDHPVYTFDWNTEDEEAAAKLFTEYCLNEKSQKLATEKGFNRNDSYKSQDSGLSGTGYLTAQSMWKQNKNGGRPIVAVFVADVSGSMGGEPLASLQDSLVATIPYIGEGHYVGLVSYATDVTINLPIDEFNNKHRAYFSGEVKGLMPSGGTATYDAVLVGLDMIEQKLEEIPDAMPIMFVLTDGEANGGYSLERIETVVASLDVPVYTIAYNYNNMTDLTTLSGLNEAASIRADSSDIVNQLRNLFNTQM